MLEEGVLKNIPEMSWVKAAKLGIKKENIF